MIDKILQALVTGYVPSTLFFIWSLFSFLISVTFVFEYFYIQHKPSKIWFAAAFFCQSIALGIASLLVAPHPWTDFEYLRPWSRLWWAIGLPFFLIAVPLHIYYVANIIWIRYRAWIIGPAGNGQKIQESHQDTTTVGGAEQATE